MYDVVGGQTTQVTSYEVSEAELSRNGQWVLTTSTDDVTGGNPNGRLQLYAQRIGGEVNQLTQIDDRDTYISGFAANADASRIAVVVRGSSPSSVLLTRSGAQPLRGVPGDASQLSFDAAGRFLAFISSEDPVRENPLHNLQLFVAVMPLVADTPTPTATPTRTPAPPKLAEELRAGDFSVMLNDARSLEESGLVRIEDEFIAYTSRSSTDLFGLTRGACGTMVATHALGTSVSAVLGGCPPTPTPTPTRAECVGDCDDSGEVTVNEIIAMVNIALGNGSVSACEAGDADKNGNVTITEIIGAVGKGLRGCA